jgi:hypothetical protein
MIAHPFLSEDFLAEERRRMADIWLPRVETVVYDDEAMGCAQLPLRLDRPGHAGGTARST